MPEWFDEHHEELWEYEPPHLEVWVTDNPNVAELWHPNGDLLLAITEREPIGFRLRE